MISLKIEKKAFVREKFMDIKSGIDKDMSKYKDKYKDKFNLYLE